MTRFQLEDEWQILDTGTLIHYDTAKPLTLSITEIDGTNINVRFELKKDNKVPTPTVKLDAFNDDTLQIFISFGSSISNFGYAKPISIGSYNGLELHFNFRIDLNDESDSALIHYTWYTGEEDQP